jgi:hypothetical protein
MAGPDITEEDAIEVANFFNPPVRGHKPGAFTTALITAITKADSVNRAKLELSYPGLVAAVTLCSRKGLRALTPYLPPEGDHE